ncbi:MAG: inositol-1-monophosphatase [Alphaproteobacteria bacterium BRH_c36]|nr:MAG: inositol-1-monophosphatase [Alphaproteobacteria bacterium BRH_c36]
MSSLKDLADQGVSRDVLRDIEHLAIELAGVAGMEITKALGNVLAVKYKSGVEEDDWRDPVSEVDDKVERLIRERLARDFPDHDIIGEEMDERPVRDADFIWVIDPIDGTANFVNGFPLFSASIGVVYKGLPVVGALWCPISHALRAGVYHCTLGGKVRFDGADVTPKGNPAVRRRLVGVPVATLSDNFWETRKTGSAAFECAMVAAGLLQAARFSSPNIWDIAGGLALVSAGGGVALRRESGVWTPMERFTPTNDDGDLRFWRGEVVIGEPMAVARMAEAQEWARQ